MRMSDAFEVSLIFVSRKEVSLYLQIFVLQLK